MFNRGMQKPLLAWLKKEAGEDWAGIPPERKPIVDCDGVVTVGFGLFHVAVPVSGQPELEYYFPNDTRYFEPYTRARFLRALRRLKK